MEKPAQQNIQDSFLNNARRDKSPVTIYLLSGVKLTGRIRSFDKYSVVLDTNNNQEQLIFKHAISTVVTSKAAQHASAERPIQSAVSTTVPSAPTASSTTSTGSSAGTGTEG